MWLAFCGSTPSLLTKTKHDDNHVCKPPPDRLFVENRPNNWLQIEKLKVKDITVESLIEELSSYPKNTRIVLNDYEGDELPLSGKLDFNKREKTFLLRPVKARHSMDKNGKWIKEY